MVGNSLVAPPDRPPPTTKGAGPPPTRAAAATTAQSVGPPPVIPTTMYHHSSSGVAKRAPLDTRRPLDPVFRSGSVYATHSTMASPPPAAAAASNHLSSSSGPTIHVFDPSASRGSTAGSIEGGGDAGRSNYDDQGGEIFGDAPDDDALGNLGAAAAVGDEEVWEGGNDEPVRSSLAGFVDDEASTQPVSNLAPPLSEEDADEVIQELGMVEQRGEYVDQEDYYYQRETTYNYEDGGAADSVSEEIHGRPPSDDGYVDENSTGNDGEVPDPSAVGGVDDVEKLDDGTDNSVLSQGNPSLVPDAQLGDVHLGSSSSAHETPKMSTLNCLETKDVTAGATNPADFHTPNRPIKPTRFVFLSDQKSVPTDLRQLEERTYKKRRDILARLHEMECRTARLTSKHAEERMDLHLAISDTFERTVAHPLESAIERVAMEREASSGRGMGLTTLERRVAYLDERMTHHTHVTLADLTREELDGIHDDLHQDVASEIRAENAKYHKIEGGIVRRFELVAGSIARNFHAECASTRAATDLLEKKLAKADPERTERLTATLSRIAELRAQIRQERAERIAADQALWEDIVRSIEAMKRALVAAA